MQQNFMPVSWRLLMQHFIRFSMIFTKDLPWVRISLYLFHQDIFKVLATKLQTYIQPPTPSMDGRLEILKMTKLNVFCKNVLQILLFLLCKIKRKEGQIFFADFLGSFSPREGIWFGQAKKGPKPSSCI